jgi:REP element-mobilizing transposase RayT
MARKKRIESIGFFHIVNRGVERRKIYMDEADHIRYLKILQESSEVYHFEVYAYALMDNHYHLLLKTTSLNLSLLMRQINARYSIYFNKKYKRVGPLWQGRFKSWYVYDERYLKSVVKYIELNPVKANIARKVGEYRWTMSSGMDTMPCWNNLFIKRIDWHKSLSTEEREEVDAVFNAKLEVQKFRVVPKVKKSLDVHFQHTKRAFAIASAIEDGYTQKMIAEYLGLSTIAISKSYKIYREKVALFAKLREKGIFWSYGKNISYKEAGDSLFIEYLYKYADFDDIALGFKLFGKRVMKSVWEETLKSDQRFIKLNFMLARVFLDIDISVNDLKEVKNARFEKLKMLAL